MIPVVFTIRTVLCKDYLEQGEKLFLCGFLKYHFNTAHLFDNLKLIFPLLMLIRVRHELDFDSLRGSFEIKRLHILYS